MELGMIYESNELPTLAIECYEASLERYPEDAATDLAKAWARIAQSRHGLGEPGEIERAAEAMRRSIEFEAGYAPSHWRLGTYLFDLGRFDEAKVAYRTATECDPEHLGGWNGLARVAIQEGEPERAIRTLQGILESYPNDATARRLLRTALVHAGRGDEASKLRAPWRRKSALGRDPWHREFRQYRQAPPLMERARADLKSGETARAVEVLEEFAEDQPHDMNVLSYLAWGYYQLGQRTDAMATIDRALAIDSRSAAVLRVLSRIRRSEGDLSGAVEAVDRILAEDPNDTTTLLEKAKLEKSRGRSAEARSIYERMLVLDQGNGNAWLLKADCEFALELWADAAVSFRAASRLSPKDQPPVIGLARSLASAGEWGRAQAALEKFKRLDARGRTLLESIKNRQL